MAKIRKFEQIKKTSLSIEAAKKLKERILAGKIPPGYHFVVDDVAKELGISRTPVRDALAKLASAGLLNYDGKSYLLAIYSANDVKELYAIRRILEVYAVQEAVLKLTSSEISQFRHTFEQAERRTEELGEDANLMIKLDAELHQLIYSGSNNKRLKIILQDILEKLGLIHNWGHIIRNVDYVESSNIAEYKKFLIALETRDRKSAAQLMEQHLISGEEFTLECLGFSEKKPMFQQQDMSLSQIKGKKR
jgi:DNA-binding GntR family transcriptional regulator